MLKRMIGELPAAEAAEILQLIGEDARARELQALGAPEKTLNELALEGKWWPHPWEHTDYQCAYLAPGPYAQGYSELTDAKSIKPDASLSGAELKVTLDKLRIWDYPGSGAHQVLFDFSANHQESEQGSASPIHFSQTYKAHEGQAGGVSGYPIFNGLCVPPTGIDFSCSVTNVANENDQSLLGFFETDVFKQGLSLINSINPALPVITEYATGLMKMFLSRRGNLLIHHFDLGLDLSTISTRPKLREGSYIVAQAPENGIKWSEWVWDPELGRIRWWKNEGVLKYNYVMFSLSRVKDQATRRSR